MSERPRGGSERDLLSELDAGVLRLTINRPDAANAITPDVRNGIIDQLAEASAALDVRAVVITAAGDRHFCTGADLRADRAAPADRPEGAPERAAGEAAAMIEGGIQRLCAAIQDCTKPVIVALNGTAAGGGAMIVLAADLVIAAERARIIQVFVRRGLVPDGGVAYMLPRLIGMHKAKELIFLGDDLGAKDAAALGIVNRVVPDGELRSATDEWAVRLASGPTKAIGWSKRMLNAALDVDRSTFFADEALLVELNTQTADSAEGVASFVERRPPEFKGW